ncbi:UbiA family prenyltransferase [Methanolobus sp. WCC4]|uniref:UbiA family prenyltransferase n=1 Tax=Methanolobus sp. WCC4 TaxID=3125784 RepID=UPI0030F89F7C
MIRNNPYISIIKPRAGLMDVSVVAINYATLGIWDYNFFFISLATFMVHGCCNIMNDIYDLDIDAICKPDGAVRSGRLSMRTSWSYMFFLLVAGLLLALYIDLILFLCLFLSFIIGGVMYSHPAFRLKDIPGVAMLSMAICFSLGSIGVWSVYSPLDLEGLLIAIYIFMLSFSLLSMKDFKDIAGDVNSLPLMVGVEKASRICIFLTVIPLLPLFYLVMYDLEFIIGAAVYVIFSLGCIRILMDDPVSKGKLLKHRMQMAFVAPSIVIFGLKILFI